jgi:hypothetical protein
LSIKEKSKAVKDTDMKKSAEKAKVSVKVEENNEKEVEMGEEGSFSQKQNKNKHFVIFHTANSKITFNGMSIMK